MDIFYNTLLFLPFFVSAFGATTLLCQWRESSRPQRVWMVFLLTMAICAFTWGIMFNDIQDYSVYYKLFAADITCMLLLFPFIFLYFRALTDPAPFTWRQYIWLAPGLAVGSGITLLFCLMGEEQSIQFMSIEKEVGADFSFEYGTLPWWAHLLTWYVFNTVFFLQTIMVLTYSTVSLVRYRKELIHLFSNLDGKSIENSRAVLIGLYVLLGMSLVCVVLWGLFYEQYYLIRYILMSTGGILIYYMTYHVSRLRFTIESIPPEDALAADTEEAPTDAPRNTSEKFLPELVRLIDEEQIFLQPNLSLSELSSLLHSNRTYISQIINTEFGCSFYDYINDKRIRFAQKITTENPALLQEQIAQKSGFIHVATFSRVFKRQTGMTFRQWQKTIDQIVSPVN